MKYGPGAFCEGEPIPSPRIGLKPARLPPRGLFLKRCGSNMESKREMQGRSAIFGPLREEAGEIRAKISQLEKEISSRRSLGGQMRAQDIGHEIRRLKARLERLQAVLDR